MRVTKAQSTPPSTIARRRAVRSGVATEVAQQMSRSASRLGARPDLKQDLRLDLRMDTMGFTPASAAPRAAFGRPPPTLSRRARRGYRQGRAHRGPCARSQTRWRVYTLWSGQGTD